MGSQSLNLSEALLNARPALRGYKDRKVVVGIRPEHLTDAALAPVTAPGTTLSADVELIEALGNELQVHFLLDATRVRSEEAQAAAETRELEGPPDTSDRRGEGRRRRPGLAPQRAQGRLTCHLRRRHRAAQLLRLRERGSHLGLTAAGRPGVTHETLIGLAAR